MESEPIGTVRRRPLEGVRVLDMTRHLAGAGATRLLAILGAEVLRIEWPHFPAIDFIRLSRPFAGGEPGMNRGAFFAQINVQKKSVAIDLGTEAGREVLRDLVPRCDVVIESFTAGVMARWGLDYAGLRKLKDDIIYVAASGFGHTGPLRDYRSVGPTAQAYSGLTAMVGLAGREPAGWGFSYMDHMGATMNAAAVLMALEKHRITGRGEFIDAGQSQNGVALMGPMLLDISLNHQKLTPRGNRDLYRNMCPSNSYRCRGTDQWLAVSVRTGDQWHALCRIVDAPEFIARDDLNTLIGRCAAEAEIDDTIAAWAASQDRDEAMRALQEAGVPAGAVQDVADKVERDPQLTYRQFYERVDDPVLGLRRYEGIGAKFEGFESHITHARPFMGQHTREVLQCLLSYTPERIDELVKAGLVVEASAQEMAGAK